MAAAAPALVVPALAGPLAPAAAKRRPPLESGPSLTLGSQAQQVDSASGAPAVRFPVIINEPLEGVVWTVVEVVVEGTPYKNLTGYWIVSGLSTVSLLVRDLDVTGLVDVTVKYIRGTETEGALQDARVVVVPAQAFGGGRPPRPR